MFQRQCLNGTLIQFRTFTAVGGIKDVILTLLKGLRLPVVQAGNLITAVTAVIRAKCNPQLSCSPLFTTVITTITTTTTSSSSSSSYGET